MEKDKSISPVPYTSPAVQKDISTSSVLCAGWESGKEENSKDKSWTPKAKKETVTVTGWGCWPIQTIHPNHQMKEKIKILKKHCLIHCNRTIHGPEADRHQR